ncbi:hypothetical protein jhhlp_004554 [Lomentospora prolificans]|uniref:HIG1 domain-containing protein n=1 Tax=Lomentospora prolificans TaxID=41688 RepID=A0A2N3NBZ0_9PEZI|nr:hypothetical protein jhhlp_004554 [Lomentospora prolificans]
MTDRDYPQTSLPSSFDSDDKFINENAWQKISRKIKEEPLIPLVSDHKANLNSPRAALGTALTCWALFNSFRAVRRGDSAGAQRMFRARVLAQGFTVMAICAGGLYYSQDRSRSRELRKVKEAQDNEEKRAKWIRELEARDEEDKAMRRRLEEKRNALATDKAAAAAPDVDAPKEGGVLSALGGMWGGNKKQGEEAAAASAPELAAVEAESTGKRKKNPRSSLDSLGEILGNKKSSNDSEKN